MFKGLIIFGAGVYTGVYFAQNYEIEKVEDPKALFEKVQAFIKTKLSEPWIHVLQPTSSVMVAMLPAQNKYLEGIHGTKKRKKRVDIVVSAMGKPVYTSSTCSRAYILNS
ncbi:hypothetical protein O3G_MSEX013485 [Manduca sexta]|uniref:MICOS complex subunit MIC13 n=1 Tax=Manduca sexta TaxID=7130 RepID=A0A922CYJ8_MANSE|nr:hypothetical protein O3G_MSEX013485 [Manduca sexta]